MSDLVLNPIECDKILICILLFSIHCFVPLSSYYKEEDCSCFALGKTRLIIVDKEEKENVSEMFSHSTVVPYSTKHFCCQFSQVVTASTSTSPFSFDTLCINSIFIHQKFLLQHKTFP